MAYISIGDRLQDIERLVGALADIKRLYSRDGSDLISGEYIQPQLVFIPLSKHFMQNVTVSRYKMLLDRFVGICYVLPAWDSAFWHQVNE